DTISAMADLARGYDAVNLVADPLHGYIKITKRSASGDVAAEQDLLDDPWLQRLRRIHQLQSAWWVFPSAEHSRFQHALGAMHLAGEWARHVYPNLRLVAPDAPSAACVEETLRVAGLLHDVGHGPFGHFFDQNYLDRFGSDHEVIGRQLILGPLAAVIRALQSSPAGPFEPGERIDPRWVGELIAEDPLPGPAPPRWVRLLKPILCGTYTVDNLDYVPRDAYMCGVAVGPVDVARLLHYTFLGEEGMLLHQHGTQALLMFLNARLYLYNNLYFHRTVRRIDLHMREIFRETIDQLLPGDPLAHLDAYQALTDWSLIESVTRWRQGAGRLRELGLEWERIVRRELKWRMIFEDYSEISEMPAGFPPQPARVEAILRAQLPADLRDASLVVDVASVDPRPQNPLQDRGAVRIYNPMSRAVESSEVADLFRRLPIRTTLLRVFTADAGRAEVLRHAVEGVLYRRDVLVGQAG
ncbi:MAG TPA: HD domain-containing protein, partial [Candidatus Eisenbacteria bacterium]|nr:HD domain-containing protein [Candidatus Eisenbacteria bacterium]